MDDLALVAYQYADPAALPPVCELCGAMDDVQEIDVRLQCCLGCRQLFDFVVYVHEDDALPF